MKTVTVFNRPIIDFFFNFQPIVYIYNKEIINWGVMTPYGDMYIGRHSSR